MTEKTSIAKKCTKKI